MPRKGGRAWENGELNRDRASETLDLMDGETENRWKQSLSRYIKLQLFASRIEGAEENFEVSHKHGHLQIQNSGKEHS